MRKIVILFIICSILSYKAQGFNDSNCFLQLTWAKNYVTYKSLQIPQRNPVFLRNSVRTYNLLPVQRFRIGKKYDFKYLKELSFDYAQLGIEVIGPSANNSIDFVRANVKLRTIVLNARIAETTGINLKAFVNFGIARYVAVRNSEKQAKLEKFGKFANQNHILSVGTEYLPLGVLPRFEIGAELLVIKTKKGNLFLVGNAGYALRDVWDIRTDNPSTSEIFFSVSPHFKSLNVGMKYIYKSTRANDTD